MISKKILQSIRGEPSEWISVWLFFVVGIAAAWLKGEIGSAIFVVMLAAHVIVMSDIVLLVFKKEKLSVHWVLLAVITYSYSILLLDAGFYKTILVFYMLGALLSIFIMSVIYFTKK